MIHSNQLRGFGFSINVCIVVLVILSFFTIAVSIYLFRHGTCLPYEPETSNVSRYIECIPVNYHAHEGRYAIEPSAMFESIIVTEVTDHAHPYIIISCVYAHSYH